ncbi:type II CAAX prenyl endopeptidase Rce1 family protein [Moritella viscosa]
MGRLRLSLVCRFEWRIGLAHFSGGTLLVIFATLADLGYALVFHFTNRLWCAVLAHLLFNFVHLIFFTYPVLAR